MIDGWSISCKTVLKLMPMDLTDGKSTLVHVMAWCRQATSHYLSQCWPRFMPPYGVTRPQWINVTCLFSGLKISIMIQRSRLRRPISKISMILLIDAKTWMTSLIIMFAVRSICVQDSIFKMSSESPVIPFQMTSRWPHTPGQPSLGCPFRRCPPFHTHTEPWPWP